jgi:hypothetical protein
VPTSNIHLFIAPHLKSSPPDGRRLSLSALTNDRLTRLIGRRRKNRRSSTPSDPANPFSIVISPARDTRRRRGRLTRDRLRPRSFPATICRRSRGVFFNRKDESKLRNGKTNKRSRRRQGALALPPHNTGAGHNNTPPEWRNMRGSLQTRRRSFLWNSAADEPKEYCQEEFLGVDAPRGE